VVFLVGAGVTLWDQPGQLWVFAPVMIGIPLYWIGRKYQLDKRGVNLKKNLQEGFQQQTLEDD
jgi:hypothetical protein